MPHISAAVLLMVGSYQKIFNSRSVPSGVNISITDVDDPTRLAKRRRERTDIHRRCAGSHGVLESTEQVMQNGFYFS